MKRRIKQTVWGNWNGYEGNKKVIEFGEDEVAAGHWFLTGESEKNKGYETEETIKAAKAACQRSI